MIKLSDMRNRILILKAEVTVDAIGNRKNTYASYCNRWAYINKSGGSESFEAGKTLEEETMRFIIRFDSETKRVNSGEYRIVFGGKTYNITSVDNYKMRNESITLLAKEVRDD